MLADEGLLLGFAGDSDFRGRRPAQRMGSVVGSRPHPDERMGSLLVDSATRLWISIHANPSQVRSRRWHVLEIPCDGCGK